MRLAEDVKNSFFFPKNQQNNNTGRCLTPLNNKQSNNSRNNKEMTINFHKTYLFAAIQIRERHHFL